MPKMKSHKGAQKRIKKTGKNKFKRKKAYRGHLLTKKTGKKKRQLRKDAMVSKEDEKNLKDMLPYS